MDRLARNLAGVRERIERASRACGRNPARIRLVCVTKSVSPDIAARLADCGEHDLGENRIDSLEAKAEVLARRGIAVRWHWLAHVQRRKARRVVRLAHAIHSLDSLELYRLLVRLAEQEGRRPQLWIQVEVGQGPRRTGLGPEAALELAEDVAGGPLPLRGFMTLAPRPPSEERRAEIAAAAFRRVADLARSLPGSWFASGRAELSMGMSADLEVAIRSGADVVRVGRALFEAVGQDAAAGGGAEEVR